VKIKSLLVLSAVALTATSFAPAVARQGADDPVGHVRREDRQADRSTEIRSSVADRSTMTREVERNDVRDVRGADDAPGHDRGGNGADDRAPHN
jgi:hypothetical protein